MLQVPASLLIMSSRHILACVSVGHAYAALIATGIKQFESKAKTDTTRMSNACKVTAKYGVICCIRAGTQMKTQTYASICLNVGSRCLYCKQDRGGVTSGVQCL